ncbi:hypothetical protein BGX38DRAFT_1094717 [Terfezia claveryi]|nr:hypothetical protein BGX38DRAFT_1094717 [Terfezia claveryi]
MAEQVARQAFTPTQWRTFMAIADTIFPAQTPEQVEEILAALPQGQGNKPAIEHFLARSASDCREFADALDDVFAHKIPSDAVVKIRMVLDLLDGGIFTFLLTRSFTGFSRLPLSTRTTILQNWSQSWLGTLRTLHRQLQLIYSNTMLKANPVLISALEYPEFPPAYTPQENDPLHPSCATSAPPFHKPNFHLKSDIVIVGSGAGGGVCAARLARELCPLGFTVTILEKAGFFSPENMPLPQIPLAQISHDNSGAISTRDGQGLCVAGTTWGGGTTINWGISLELEPPITHEWSSKYGLKGVLEGRDYQDCQKHVRERMGGAKKVGLDPAPLPQNCGGRMDEHVKCSHCSSGCRSGCKQGTANSFLVDAEKAGAKCISGVEITNIIWSPESTSEKICAGVEGWIVNPPSMNPSSSTSPTKPKRKFRLLSPRVVLSTGALRTPTILQSSSLTNPSIGKNLRVHPCLLVYGLTSPDQPMEPWDGTPTTVLVPTTNDKSLPMKSKLMRMDPPPSMALTCLPWYDATEYLKTVLSYKHSITLLTLVRDTDSSGEVGKGGTQTASGEVGPPDIGYTFSAKDRATAIDGIILSCKVLLEGGCKSVVPCIPLPRHLARFTTQVGVDSPTATSEFGKWAEAVRRYGCGMGWVSGHLMGTARWGGKAGDGSVCDGENGGRVWGTKGVYVVDGSAFPTASGVNPMLTIMGLAEWAGRRIVEEVKGEMDVSA